MSGPRRSTSRYVAALCISSDVPVSSLTKGALVLVGASLAIIARASAAQHAAAQTVPTFAVDIAPIIWSQCAGCHRPGGSAPFDLLTYADVKRRAGLVVETTKRRYMPPLKPEPGSGEFEGVRRLTDQQIDVIQQWVRGGAPEGDPAALPPVPKWSSAWTLGEPDLVLSLERPYTLRAAGE